MCGGEGLSTRCRYIEFLYTGRWGCWTDHIPLDYVVTYRERLNPLDVLRRYPYDGSSVPTAISIEGNAWDRPPTRLAKIAPSLSIFTTNPRIFSCSAMVRRSWN